MGLIIFKTIKNPSLDYAIISYIVVALGVSSSIFFLYQVREKPLA